MCIFLNHFTPFIFVVDIIFSFFDDSLGLKVTAGEGRLLESQKQLQTAEEENTNLQNQVRPTHQYTVYIANCLSLYWSVCLWSGKVAMDM